MAAGKAWVKGKAEAGKAWVKGKAEAGKAWVKGKAEAGKAWAKEKAATGKAWVKAKLGIKDKVPFSAKGKSHELTVTVDSPDKVVLVVASTPRVLGAAMSRAMEAADIDTLVEARGRVAEATSIRDSRARVAAREQALKDLARATMMRTGTQMRLTPELHQSARALANAIAECWNLIGYDGESIGRVDRSGAAGQPGDVHAHSKKGSEYDPGLSGRQRTVSRLESEHVVPWGWIQQIVTSLFGLGNLPSQGGTGTDRSFAYPRLTTVMTYERAAEFKTSQLENNDRMFRDWISGLSRQEAQQTLAHHLPTLVLSRMQIIRSATGLYIAKVQREDGITLPDRPDEATIRRATAAQLGEIFAAVREARR